ncbi:MAG: glutaredoxin family protein [Gemmatimonadetes bacterium]|nr:glutaredoxin family protein [Gemmatimonadota bacterium]
MSIRWFPSRFRRDRFGPRRILRLQAWLSRSNCTVTRIEIFTKRDCHLCDVAKAALLRVQREVPFELREIDIESSAELYVAYKERIPVIAIDGKPAFQFRVDEERLRRRLGRASPPT